MRKVLVKGPGGHRTLIEGIKTLLLVKGGAAAPLAVGDGNSRLGGILQGSLWRYAT